MAKELKAKKSVKPERTTGKVFRDSAGNFASGQLVSNKRSIPSGNVESAEPAIRTNSPALNRSATRGEGKQVMNYAHVLAHAVETFGSRVNANEWLNRPNRMFANKTPLQILTADPEAVEEELVRIDHGMFA
jgi:hypothetical protein